MSTGLQLQLFISFYLLLALFYFVTIYGFYFISGFSLQFVFLNMFNYHQYCCVTGRCSCFRANERHYWPDPSRRKLLWCRGLLCSNWTWWCGTVPDRPCPTEKTKQSQSRQTFIATYLFTALRPHGLLTIWSFMVFPSSSMVLILKSTPMVLM